MGSDDPRKATTLAPAYSLLACFITQTSPPIRAVERMSGHDIALVWKMGLMKEMKGVEMEAVTTMPLPEMGRGEEAARGRRGQRVESRMEEEEEERKR